LERWFKLLRCPIHDMDVATQEWVYRSFSQFVHKDIFSISHDHELTKDITQEAFIKAVKHGPRLQSDENIPGWIRRVARNTAIDFLRKWNNGHRMVGYICDSIYAKVRNEVSVASEVETKVKIELLYLALSELKSDYKTVLLLFYLSGKSYREISKELNLGEAVVSQRLARARKKLLQHFLEKWADHDE